MYVDVYMRNFVSLLVHLCRTPGAPIDDRIKDLLGRMNQDEKIAQMASVKRDSLAVSEAQFLSPDAVPTLTIVTCTPGGIPTCVPCNCPGTARRYRLAANTRKTSSATTRLVRVYAPQDLW